jgi:hypothetical protein
MVITNKKFPATIFIFMTMTKIDRSGANCVQADEAIHATRHKTPQI